MSWVRKSLRNLPAKLLPKRKLVFARDITEAPVTDIEASVSIHQHAGKQKAQSALSPLNPEPSYLEKGERNLGELSVRELRLGMSFREARLQKGSGENVDRIRTYWKKSAETTREFRYGATWLKFDRYYGSFDVDGTCGAVYGDGLERRGIPILACGDTGADVERLLGAPNGAAHSWGARDSRDATWSYNLDDSYLSVHFRDGVVSRFTLPERGFIDSGC